MNENNKNIVIFGAGRIGRGFIGDLFATAGYQLVFVDQAQALVDMLNSRKVYTVVRATSDDSIERVKIQNYKAYHGSLTEQVEEAVSETDLIAVAVFPKDFESAATTIAELIIKRKLRKADRPINIIICTNLVHAGPIFKQYLYQNLDEQVKQYFDTHVGVVESLVIRIAPNPPLEEVESDPLIIWTNGFSEFPVEKAAFKGDLPELPFLRYVEDMRSEEKRKIYTYNMCHAVLSYHGYQYDYELLVDCLADPTLRQEAEGALEEVSCALQREFNFSEAEMLTWNKGVIAQTNIRTIGDTVIRMAADPVRKLQRDDRLIGPALLCIKNGIEPVHLINAIGAAFNYVNVGDSASLSLQELVKKEGIPYAIKKVCGLTEKPEEIELANKIEEAHRQNLIKLEWLKKAKQAYDLGFQYEKDYHGCGQSVFAAVAEVLDIFSPDVFKTATGLCGGIGLNTDSTCSAYIGGVLAIGLLFNRRREYFGGDRESKYLNFEIVQKLREKFVLEFGSQKCCEIHQNRYGRFFDLRKKEEGQLFEQAGAHGDSGCTMVVGKAAQFTIQVLIPYLMKTQGD